MIDVDVGGADVHDGGSSNDDAVIAGIMDGAEGPGTTNQFRRPGTCLIRSPTTGYCGRVGGA